MSTTTQSLETVKPNQENYTFAYLDDSIDQLQLFETYSQIGIDSNHEIHLYNPHHQTGNIVGGIEELLENAHQYDAIVLDWDLKMRDVDGLKIAQELRKEYEQPIILYSNTREEKMLEEYNKNHNQEMHESIEETLTNFKFNKKDIKELTKTLNQL